MKYKFNNEHFGDGVPLVELLKPVDSGNTKFNIKVRKSDVALIDALADRSGRTRSYVMNYLIRHILKKTLSAYEQDDRDVAAYIALAADERRGMDERSLGGWVSELFAAEQTHYAEGYYFFRERNDPPPSDKAKQIRRLLAEKKK